MAGNENAHKCHFEPFGFAQDRLPEKSCAVIRSPLSVYFRFDHFVLWHFHEVR